MGDYKSKIASLAGGKTFYPVKVRENLVKAFTLAQVHEDGLGAKFVARLEKMKDEDDTEMMGL